MRKRLTDKLERIKQAAGNGLRREISEDFKYDKKKLKHIKRVLHNVNVALGTLVSALNEFSKLKAPDISPDGMLGGLGYIMSVRDIKEILNGSVKNLSDVTDSLADELGNPRWDAGDDQEVKKLLKEKEEIEEKVDEEMEDDIGPDEVVTSAEVYETSKTANAALEEAIKDALVRFSSTRKPKRQGE